MDTHTKEIDLLRDELQAHRDLVALLTGLLGRMVRRDGLPEEELAEVQATVASLLDLSERQREDLMRQIRDAAEEVRK